MNTRFLAIPLLGISALLIGGLLVVGGCKQGQGERCQVTADCQSGLICNLGTNPPSCAASSGGGIDATPPPDSDAALDGPPDAPDAPDA